MFLRKRVNERISRNFFGAAEHCSEASANSAGGIDEEAVTFASTEPKVARPEPQPAPAKVVLNNPVLPDYLFPLKRLNAAGPCRREGVDVLRK
jgi:hypothetical protein